MEKKFDIGSFFETSISGDATFSPDGTQVAYLSTLSGTPQIFLKNVQGDKSEQLTHFEDGVGFAHFSPTENVILFGKSEGGNECTQFFILDTTTRHIKTLTNDLKVRHNFGGWSPDGKNICFTSNERNGADFDVYIADIKTFDKQLLIADGGSYSANGFSPRGTYIVVQKKHSNVNNDLYLYTLKNGAVRHLTPHATNAFYSNPSWLPDESAFFLIQNEGREFFGLARHSIETNTREYILTPEWDIDSVTINQQGTRLVVTINEEGYKKAHVYDPHTLSYLNQKFPEGNISRPLFSPNGFQLSCNVGSSQKVLSSWIINFDKNTTYQLTQSKQLVPPEIMVEPELIRYISFDGLSIPAFLYKPNTKENNTKFPVLIDIHGGPEDQYLPFYQPLVQHLVHQGFMVVAPNVRGSSGYGSSYLALDDREKRLNSVRDIVALRNYLIERPDVAHDKIVLHGASYGGFMVLACMAFYPQYWAAGVDIVGITNFITFLENTAPYRRALREAEYGSLENDRKLLEEISPIHAVGNITAPLMVIHGANDPRVPLSEATQLVEKLNALKRDVELVIYEDEGHGIVKRKNKLDAYQKIVEFLRRVVG